jgi:hypothetical protein
MTAIPRDFGDDGDLSTHTSGPKLSLLKYPLAGGSSDYQGRGKLGAIRGLSDRRGAGRFGVFPAGAAPGEAYQSLHKITEMSICFV